MEVIAVQLDIQWENKRVNFDRVRHLLGQAAPPPGALVALPEMFATGFSMNAEQIAEPYGGPTELFLAEVAKQYQVYMLGGAAMRGREGKARNKALVFSPAGELVSYYAKMRLFTPGAEHKHYGPGTRPTVFRCGDCGVAPFVCYDLRFPELFREAAAASAPEAYVVIANWPEKRIAHWARLLQSRAIENQAYVIGVNRVGRDPFYTYSGRSLIIDSNGEILADAGSAETFIRARLDLATIRKYREGLPFLKDLKLPL